MSTQHTPGPWIVTVIAGEPHVGTPPQSLTHIMRDLICLPYGTELNNGNYKESALANARLIAAAPELLQALLAILQNFDSGDLSILWTNDEPNPVNFDFARAAIAKAAGNA